MLKRYLNALEEVGQEMPTCRDGWFSDLYNVLSLSLFLPLTLPHTLGSLNSFALKPDEAERAFNHCLMESEDYKNLQLDASHRRYMPIYLGATAGMRVLR